MQKVSDGTTIGGLGRATGVNIETIRYYEKIGLMPPPARTEGNYRVYGPEHVRRLTFVRKARDLGFSIDSIRTLLDLADHPDRPCADVDDLVQARLRDVERKIADLERLRGELVRLAGQCRGGAVSDCRILEALTPE